MPRKRLGPILVLLCLVSLPLAAEEEKEDRTVQERAQQLWGPRGAEVLVLNLKECLDRALRFNRELEVADSAIKTAEEKKDEVRKIGYPILDYEYNIGPAPKDVSNAVESFFSGDLTVFNKLRVGVGVPLQTFGKVKTGKQLAGLGIEAEKEKKVQKKSEIALKVHQLYYGILLAREIRRLLNSANKELIKEIEKREAREGQDPSQLLKLKLFQAELERRIQESEKRELMAREALRVLVDVDPRVRFDIPAERLWPIEKKLPSFEKLKGEAIGERSELKQLEIGYQVRQKQVSLEKRLPTPNLGLGAFFEMGRTPGVTGLTATDDFTDPLNFTRAGVGLRLTGQFDFHGAAAKIRQAKSELYKTGIQRDLAQEGVLLEVKESYLDAQIAEQEIGRAEEAGKLSRQLLFLTQSNYDIGLAESKDLVDGLQSFLETRGKYFEAVFNYNVAVAKLYQKAGRIPE